MSAVSTAAVLAALAIVSTAGLCAHAAGSVEDEAFQKQIFNRAIGKDRIHACYRRVYDASHLASHPQQNTRTMTLLVTGSAEESGSPTYVLGLGMTFRKTGTHFETYGDCGSIHGAGANAGPATAVHCAVDCDGGSIDVALKNAQSVLVSIPEGARIWKAGASSENDESQRFGTDDKLFRLDRTKLTDCLSLAGEDDDKALLRKGQ